MRSRCLLLAAVASLVLASTSPAGAQSAEAETHFKRGVSLYQEGDFKAALAEFRRAYEISHKWQLLYNVGQAEYQTHDYAAALSSFETFLREGGERIPKSRRADIEQEIARLRMRVGKVTVRANVAGAAVLIDDELVGTVPVTRNVAVGGRRILVKKEGYAPWSRSVEVASGDDLQFDVVLEGGPPVPSRAESSPGPASPPPPPPPGGPGGHRFFWEPWAVTGVLAAATVTTGILALGASSRLDHEKNRYDVTDEELDDASSRAKTFAVVTDIFFFTTLAAAGVSVYFTLKPPSWTQAASLRVAPSASGLFAAGRF
ncbi:MAG TPA: PEGA domain-containing protein [Labilithrix sp.]|nr:PEGA domain-containing protein [Labilithrix sp.]